MKGKFPIVLVLCVTLLAAAGWFAWEKYGQNTSEHTTTQSDFLMRNLTWWTPLEEFTPYRKNDEVELVFIIEPTNDANRAKVDVSELKNRLEGISLKINDIPVQESELNDFPISEAFKITVRGKGKENTMSWMEPNDLLKIRFSKRTDSSAKSETDLESTWSGNIRPESRSGKPSEVSLPTGILSSNIDNLIPLTGTWLDTIDRVVVGEKSFKGGVKDGVYYFILPKNTFGDGEYFAGLYLKTGELVPLDSKLTFTYNPSPINIAAITPNTIRNDQDSYVVVQGNGFRRMISLQLSNNLIFKNTLFTVVNDQVASVKIPKWLEPGTYYFNMMDTQWIYEARNMTFTITP